MFLRQFRRYCKHDRGSLQRPSVVAGTRPASIWKVLWKPFRLANGRPHYELGQVYESIRVQLHAIPSVLFLNQQDLRDFVAPPGEYIPECQTNLTIEEITAAYSIYQLTLICKIPPTLSMALNPGH